MIKGTKHLYLEISYSENTIRKHPIDRLIGEIKLCSEREGT